MLRQSSRHRIACYGLAENTAAAARWLGRAGTPWHVPSPRRADPVEAASMLTAPAD
jgi:hypothetical protein